MVRPEVRARLAVGPLLFVSACAQGSLGVSPGTILSTIIVATGTTIPRTTPSEPRPSSPRRRIPASPAPSATASRILHTADAYVGVPYTWGGNTPKGFDCSGFTKYVFAKHGITLPRTAREQARVGSGIAPDFASLRPGDLMMFAEPGEAISHVAIYVGSGEIIHSSSSVGGVGYTDLNTGGEWFVQNLVAARRVR